MKTKLFTILALLGCVLAGHAAALNVVVRGTGAQEWSQLLNQRGAKATAVAEFPSAQQLEGASVLVLAGAAGTEFTAEQRQALEKFVQKGGGVVTFGSPLISSDSAWLFGLIGGAGEKASARLLEGTLSFYYVDKGHPITKQTSNFEVKDAIAYDLNVRPEAHVLAAAYTPKAPNTEKGLKSTEGGKRASVYDIQPQMWIYEKGGHRSFVSILGSELATTRLPHYRAVLLRGIAWAAKRRNVNELCSKDELASLTYPEGGPTAPEKATAKLELHPDFNISLAAAEPLVNKPIAIDWDPQGRLWVAETPEYPNGRREHERADMKNAPWKDAGSLMPGKANRPATDRIVFLSKPDRKGRFQQKQIFYEGLELVTGFVFHKDGVIVAQAPDILFLRDTNKDGKADKVEKLYTGLGIRDTHAVINNLRWGFDGWIYATHGYSAGDVTSGDGKKAFGKIGSGVVRFKPDGSAFEQYCSKGGNTWGLDIAWDGEVFFTQPTSGHLLNHVVMSEEELTRSKAGKTVSYKPLIVQRRSLPLINYEQQAYVQIDQVGMFTASAGCAIYGGGSWPKEWNYGYFTTEPTINILHHEAVEPQSASYAAHKVREAEFIGGKDMWFRPIETRVGPDGALYVLDFYNQAVIHNDTRGPVHGPANAAVRPDRDHYFGRIWKLDHKQAQKLKVPNLAKANGAELVDALQHPNLAVRQTALRLLVEQKPRNSAGALKQLVASGKSAEAKVLGLWALGRMEALDSDTLMAVGNDTSPAVRKNALKVATVQNPRQDAVLQLASKLADDGDARVRLEALLALGNFEVNAETARALALAYPKLEDEWLKAAFVGVAAKSPESFLEAAFDSRQPEVFAGLAAEMTSQIVSKNSSEAGRIVAIAAAKPVIADPVKRAVLLSLAQNVKAGNEPRWSSELQQQLRSLLESNNAGVASAALPLAVRWDKGNTLAVETKSAVSKLTAQVSDAKLPDGQRADAASALVELKQPEALQAIGKTLPSASATLKGRLIETLSGSSDAAAGQVLIEVLPTLDEESGALAFDAIMKRSSWSLALLSALESGKLDASKLSPANTYRLRTHGNSEVAQKAGELVDRLRGPAVKQKGELITKLVPVVSQRGNATKGKELFTQNCATCHKLGENGNEVGPILTGMGAHGPAELLVHILDPNREVDHSYLAYNVETKDGETYTGIVSRENKASVFVKNAGGLEKEIPRKEIKSQRSTGLSLMPEGFEALGEESLRDLLTFMCGDSSRFRFVDLSSAFTADTRGGLFYDEARKDESLSFTKYGPITVEGVPFNVVDPARSPVRKNVVVLKGGEGYAASMPQRAEAKVGFAASRLHFLGGIGGWAYPGGGKLPALKATVHYVGGQSEELVMHNGEEFADYIRVIDVPGSRLARGVVDSHQVRWFTKPLKHRAVIDRIVLESFENRVAPVTVAITAEAAEESGR